MQDAYNLAALMLAAVAIGLLVAGAWGWALVLGLCAAVAHVAATVEEHG